MLAGDLCRRRGDLPRALDAYRAAVASLAAAGDRLAAALNLAEGLADAGDASAARAVLAEARTLADANTVDAWLPVAIRVALALGDPIRIPRPRSAHCATAPPAAPAATSPSAPTSPSRASTSAAATASAPSRHSRAPRPGRRSQPPAPRVRRDADDDDPDARRLRELLSAAGEAAPDCTKHRCRPRRRRSRSPIRCASCSRSTNASTPSCACRVLLDLHPDTVIDLLDCPPSAASSSSPDAGEAKLATLSVRAQTHRTSDQLASRQAASFHAASPSTPRAKASPSSPLDASGDAPLRSRALRQRSQAALGPRRSARRQRARPSAASTPTTACAPAPSATPRSRSSAISPSRPPIAVENARLLAELRARAKEIDALNRSLQQEVAKQARRARRAAQGGPLEPRRVHGPLQL